MNKLRLAAPLAALLLVVGCSKTADSQDQEANPATPSTASTDVKQVAITAIVEHPALDAVRVGVEDELKEAGFIQGQNIKVVFQSAQGNTATAGQIAKKFIGDKSAAIVAIGTPSAQAVAASTRDIPLVFAAVTDPVAAKLTPSWEASGTNVTGVSDALPLEPQIDLIKALIPTVKNIGFVYSPGEVNSTIIFDQLKTTLAKDGIGAIGAPAQRTADVATAARSLLGKVDVIYSTTDNNVVSAYESLYKVGLENKLPLIASDPDSAKRGAVAALGANYYDMGRQTGKIVVRILNGESAGAIAPEKMASFDLILNKKSAALMGVTIPEAILQSAKEVIE
ncbi:MAG: ABC transporter substrate-binding protein [Neisseriaceae bacterium]|nr:ABC transporter substrate-binding protein [Neisseriaceae bacterium]MBP6860842.1 ABC transporter substrate-binding protein [Neisseriaceae bacterium]